MYCSGCHWFPLRVTSPSVNCSVLVCFLHAVSQLLHGQGTLYCVSIHHPGCPVVVVCWLFGSDTTYSAQIFCRLSTYSLVWSLSFSRYLSFLSLSFFLPLPHFLSISFSLFLSVSCSRPLSRSHPLSHSHSLSLSVLCLFVVLDVNQCNSTHMELRCCLIETICPNWMWNYFSKTERSVMVDGSSPWYLCFTTPKRKDAVSTQG